MQRANAAVPGCRAALARPSTSRPARSRCSSCRRRTIRCGRTQLRDGDADPAFAAQVAASAGAHPRRDGRRSRPSRREFPTDAIFYDIRLEPYLVATARAHPDLAAPLAGAGRNDPGQQARPGAWRCQPEEHPARPGRPGVPRCGVRLVGRSGVRPRVLPQPPAAEVPVDAARHATGSSPASMRSPPRYLAGVDLGAAGRTGSARRAPAARAVARQGGWQVAGRVHHRRSRTRTGCGAPPGAARRTRSRRSAMCARPGRKELAA